MERLQLDSRLYYKTKILPTLALKPPIDLHGLQVQPERKKKVQKGIFISSAIVVPKCMGGAPIYC